MNLKEKVTINWALVVASISIFGYISAFVYKFGEYTFYNIPTYMAEVTVEDAISSSLSTLVILLLLIVLLFVIYKLPNRRGQTLNDVPIKKPTLKDTLIITVILIMIPALVLPFSNFSLLGKGIFFVSFTLVILLLIFLRPLLSYTSVKGFRNKFEKYSEDMFQEQLKKADNKRKEPSKLFTSIINLSYIYFNQLIIILFIFSWVFISGFLGWVDSVQRDTYSITQVGNEEYFVLGKFKDKLLVVGVDEVRKVSKKDFKLLITNNDMKFEVKKIGRLNESKDKSYNYFDILKH